MSNWHARAGDKDGNAYMILFHIPIPSANNRVGVNYRTALIASGIGGTTRMAEGIGAGLITTAEKGDIAAGILYEHAELIFTNPGETAAQLQTRIDARYTELANVNNPFIVGLKALIEYWGKDRDVP